MDGPGEAIEWAVKMTRLPEEATLRERLRREEVGGRAGGGPGAPDRRIPRPGRGRPAHLGRRALRGGRPERARELRAVCVAGGHHAQPGRVREAAAVDRGGPGPASAGASRTGPHGACRATPTATCGSATSTSSPNDSRPDDLVIVDCIEFDERFRHADPVADMAFLAMDFARHGRRDLGRAFADAYFRASGDEEGRTLLPFYAAYRAAVRGKVEGLKHSEREVPAADRAQALDKARAHWLLALGELEDPGRRPCLVLVGGLPGTGKSTLARALAEQAGFTVIRSDLVRKELAALAGEERWAGRLRRGDLQPCVGRADLCRVLAAGRGNALRGEEGPGGCELRQGGESSPLPRAGGSLGRAGDPPPLPGRAGRRPGAARGTPA